MTDRDFLIKQLRSDIENARQTAEHDVLLSEAADLLERDAAVLEGLLSDGAIEATAVSLISNGEPDDLTRDEAATAIKIALQHAQSSGRKEAARMTPSPNRDVPEEAVKALMLGRIAEQHGNRYSDVGGWDEFHKDRPADAKLLRELALGDARAAAPAIRAQERQRVREVLKGKKAVRAAARSLFPGTKIGPGTSYPHVLDALEAALDTEDSDG